MQNNFKLSIITATYNSESTIFNALNSVLNLEGTNYEYVIIDGNSSDNTVSILNSFKSKFEEKGIEFSYISEKDTGIYDAFNKGIELSKGEWICFLGSDDILLPNYLSEFFNFPLTKQLDFASCKSDVTNNGGKIKEFGIAWSWEIFKKEMKVLHVGAFHNRNYFFKHGKFDTSFRIAGDYEMLLRAGKELKTGFIDKVLVNMGDEGVSSTQVVKSLSEAKKAKIKNGARSPFKAQIDYNWVLLKIRIKGVLGKA